MGSLLEFQHCLLKDKKAIYNITKAKISIKKNHEEVEKTPKTYSLESYDLKNLREYIFEKSDELTTNGNIIGGEIINNNVTLTVLK